MKLITGHFITALNHLKPQVVLTFTSSRGVLWGFSKAICEDIPAVVELSRVGDVRPLVGAWQYKAINGTQFAMGYIEPPEFSTVMSGLENILTSVFKSMHQNKLDSIILPYLGNATATSNLVEFIATVERCAKPYKGLDIMIATTLVDGLAIGDVLNYDRNGPATPRPSRGNGTRECANPYLRTSGLRASTVNYVHSRY